MSAPELELTVAWQQWISHDTGRLVGVLARHREPHRRYHTATHVRWVLRHVDSLAATEPVTHHAGVVAAAFYHDAIYDPARSDNEHLSAELARRDLGSLGWVEDRVVRVAAMIEATAHVGARSPTLPDVDTAVLLDADLAVLGADPAAYSTYVAGVRQEYGHVDDPSWRAGRGAVITQFLARDQIYATPTGRGRWEAHARANLTAELASLR